MTATTPGTLAKYIGYVDVALKPSTISTPITSSNVVANTSLLKGLSYTRIASITDLQVSKDMSANLVQVDTDTNGTIYKATRPDAVATFSFREVFTSAVEDLITNAEVVDVASTPVSVTGEVIAATGVTKGDVYHVLYNNGDGTVVSSVVVDYNGTPLVLGTDYTIEIDSDGSITGTKGQTYIVFLTTSAGSLQVDIDYTYTPSASKLVFQNATTQELPELVVQITAYSDNVEGSATTLKMRLYDTNFTGVLLQAFQDVQNTGDITPSTSEFRVNKNGFYLTEDEINV